MEVCFTILYLPFYATATTFGGGAWGTGLLAIVVTISGCHR